MDQSISVHGAKADYRHFKERPLPAFIDAVKSHIARTGQPETFEDLYRHPLSKDEPFVILTPIEIDTRLRPERDLAPCPMCHASNKFKEGRLVFLLNLGVAAVIGHECASLETNREADREYRLREKQKNEEDYLLATIPFLRERIAIAEEALPACKEVSGFLRKFRTDGQLFYRALRKASTGSGQLIVTETLQASPEGPRGIRASGSSVETRDHLVGVLRGKVALLPSFDPFKQLDAVCQALMSYAANDEMEAIEHVARLNEKERTAAVKSLKKAENDYSTLREKMRDFLFFLSDRNIATVNEWANHEFSAFKFKLSLQPPQQDGRRRFEASTSGGYFQHQVSPVVWRELSPLSLSAMP